MKKIKAEFEMKYIRYKGKKSGDKIIRKIYEKCGYVARYESIDGINVNDRILINTEDGDGDSIIDIGMYVCIIKLTCEPILMICSSKHFRNTYKKYIDKDTCKGKKQFLKRMEAAISRYKSNTAHAKD